MLRSVRTQTEVLAPNKGISPFVRYRVTQCEMT